ncbi:MAG: VOC family protein [Chloroflexi bacterium]|nr:VOC family protein [Chloroflexota bacterium]
MAFTRIHHVGMVAGNLEEARRVYCQGFGLAVDERRTPIEGRPGYYDNVTTIELPIGEMYIEVSRPNDPNTPAGRFLAERGGLGGLHYVSLASNDLTDDVQQLIKQGARIYQYPGMPEWDGKNAVFLEPETTKGLLLQVAPEDNYFAHPAFRGDGTFIGMGHVGLAARDVEETRRFWGEFFGLEEDRRRERGNEERPRQTGGLGPQDPVHIVEFSLGGSVIEISHPTDTTSGTARYVAQRATLGAAYHHICPWAPDVHRAIERARALGLQQIGGVPPREVTTRVVAWFHPKSCVGCLMEIWNRPETEQ